jgi:hypothetical protein
VADNLGYAPKSVEEKTRTVLTIDEDEAKFNRHLDEKLFTPESLGNAPATAH